MSLPARLALSLVVALALGFSFMMLDNWRGAQWEVSPQSIEAAKAEGRMGVETRPGSVAVLPIRSETADVLPLKWALTGLLGGFAVFAGTGRRRKKA
jgi:hypothetical protein